MTTEEMKKSLYREKPEAKMLYTKSTGIYYRTWLNNGVCIVFKVPLTDLGEAEWLASMPAQLLLRYIIN